MKAALLPVHSLPIGYADWFHPQSIPSEASFNPVHEAQWTFLAPSVPTAILAMGYGLGILANLPSGALEWAHRIAHLECAAWQP